MGEIFLRDISMRLKCLENGILEIEETLVSVVFNVNMSRRLTTGVIRGNDVVEKLH